MRIGIVGIGGAGAMAAWQLAEAGHDVVGFEQFELDHDFGSSYGGSRIVRQVYADSYYTALMARSFELWDNLQSRWPDQQLISRCGGVFFGPQSHPEVIAARAALTRSAVPFAEITFDEFNGRFPGIILRPGETALYEPGMGYANPSLATRASAALAQAAGAKIHTNSPVERIDLQTYVRIILANGEEFVVDRVIIASGAWTNRLLETLGCVIPLTVTRQVYCHFENLPDSSRADTLPVWIDAAAYYYGFPQIDGERGVKVARHFPGTVVDADMVDRTVTGGDLDALCSYAAGRLPKAGPEVLSSKVCLYSNTPDEDFVIDFLPGDRRVVILSACSGHGYKFTPLVGELAKQLVVGGSAEIDIQRFSASRF